MHCCSFHNRTSTTWTKTVQDVSGGSVSVVVECTCYASEVCSRFSCMLCLTCLNF
jgi:hypothetical protein